MRSCRLLGGKYSTQLRPNHRGKLKGGLKENRDSGLRVKKEKPIPF